MKRISLIIIVLVLVGGAVGVFVWQAGTKQVQAQSSVPTATVQRGNLVATVNAAGNITAHQQVSLNFGQAGTVQKVDVNVGDHVKAGQVLAELDTSNLSLQVQDAQVNLKIAQDKLAQAQNPSTAQDIANARAQLDAAQANYNKLAAGPSASDLAAARSAVTSAQAAYDAALKSAGTSSSQLEAAGAAVEKATAALQQAQASYDKVASQPDIAARPEAITLENATIDYDQAKANYEALKATSNTDNNSKVAQAKSQLEQAQANLAKLKDQVTQNDLIASQAQVTEAKNNLDKLLAGSDASSLDIAQNGVDQAEIALKQAQLQLQQAQVVAPFDGVVTAVNITPGQNATTSSAAGAIQLADLDHLETIVNLAEVDVSKIKQGQAAQITLDALPNVTLQGQVSLVAPAGVLTQGVVNYPVTVALINPAAGVKTGMTANVNVIIDQRTDVLTVPNRAVRTQGRQQFVTVLFEGQQMQVPVTTGLSSDTETEITSGLKEGDAVVIASTTTTRPGTGPGPGGFGGPGGAIFGGR